jgi:hypothetical protein
VAEFFGYGGLIMPISQNDASAALRLVDEAHARSLTLRGYNLASPHLILWGVVYFAAYIYGYLQPAGAGLVWAVVVPAAVIGDLLIARRNKAGGLSGAQMGTFAGIFATFLAFITATAVIMRPQDPRQIAAFVPLVVAAAYILFGLGKGWRLSLTGVALGALTMIGYFALPGSFMLWMAVVGGGALLAGGLWLRQV